MTVRRDLRHGRRIARAEFRRSVRRATGDWRRLVGLAVAALFFGGALLVTLPTTYLIGRAARSVSAVPFFAPAATLLPVTLLSIAAFRTVERIGGSEAEGLLLTTVHPRAVVVGLIGSEIARLSVWIGLPIAATVVAFALGLGSPTLVVTAAAVAVPTVCWAAVWGYAVGIAALRLLRRLPRVRRVAKWVGVGAVLLAIAGSQLAGQLLADDATAVASLLDTVAVAPVAEYVALAFVGTPLSQPVTPAAVAVLAGVLVLTPVGLAVAVGQATALWYSDTTVGSGRSGRTGSGGFDAPRPFAAAPSGRIAWGHLVRAVRHPQELSHLVIVVFFIGPIGSTIVQSSGDALGLLVAGTGAGLGTYLAGATFGLNPLGDARPQLPLLLLTGPDARTIVRGRVVAGLAVGLPVVWLLSGVGAWLGAPPAAAAFGIVGSVLCLPAAAFAVGIGTAYPVYEEREFWGSETVVPSTLVTLSYLAVVGGGTAIALVVTWYGLSGVALTTATTAGLAVSFLLTLGVPYGCYRYAVRRYRRYTVDR